MPKMDFNFFPIVNKILNFLKFLKILNALKVNFILRTPIFIINTDFKEAKPFPDHKKIWAETEVEIHY